MKRIAASLLLSLSLPSAAGAAQLVSGPMVGDTTPLQSRIWIQTDGPAVFQIRYWPAGQPESSRLSPTVTTSEAQFNTGTVTLGDLQPGQAYQYQLLLDNQPVARNYPLRFSTPPLITADAESLPPMHFLVGSCYYLDDPLMKAVHVSYGTGQEIFTSMNRIGGDLMFWLGDNIYFAPFDLSNRFNMNRRYLKQRSIPELQPLLGGMPQLAIWDDHDFGPNNSNQTFGGKEDTLALFNAYWANPPGGQLSSEGTFFSKTWGDVEFIATDDRFHRDPDDDPNPNHSFFGQAQLKWIESRLQASQATFKIVVVGTPTLNRHYIEALPQAQGEYQDLMGFLERQHISGVVFLTGDLHYAMLMKMPRPGSYPLYEFTSSPLTSNPPQLSDKEKSDDWIVPGTLYINRNFGRISVTGPRGRRVLTLETYNTQGERVWEHRIPQQELGG